MKYLKKFNESIKNESVYYRFNNWIKENITDEDILYYFSEFTDEFEWEYRVIHSIDDINYKNKIDSFIKNGYVEFEFFFITSIDFKSNASGFIKLGEELKSFHICLNQFKNQEEDIKDMVDKVSIVASPKGERVRIVIRFKKLIPNDIITKFHKELEEEKYKVNRGSNDERYGITDDDINDVISSIDGMGFTDDIYDILGSLGYDVDDIEVNYEFDYVGLNSNDERIISILPLILINGVVNDEVSEKVSNIFFNFDQDEFDN